MQSVKARIDQDYYKLVAAADAAPNDAARRLRCAYNAAEQGERDHRRMGRPVGKYGQTIKTAARYFVVKWFLEYDDKPITYARAASIRADALHALALRELLDAESLNPFKDSPAVSSDVDYTVDIAKHV